MGRLDKIAIWVGLAIGISAAVLGLCLYGEVRSLFQNQIKMVDALELSTQVTRHIVERMGLDIVEIPGKPAQESRIVIERRAF